MIKFGIIYPSSRNKSYDDTFLLEQRLLQRENQKKSLSYGDTAKFEIRLNDRDYKVGDIVKYTCIDSPIVDEKISKKMYYITFITNYEQKDDYVVFGEREVEQ